MNDNKGRIWKESVVTDLKVPYCLDSRLERLRKTTKIIIARNLTDIWTVYFPNTNLEHNR
jgi:hypothetical protein